MYTGPSIDHGVLSPSGHTSKRAMEAMKERNRARLFPPGFWDRTPESEQEKDEKRINQLLAAAANLRDLASRGMSPRTFPKQAAAMEAEAAVLSARQPKGVE